MDAYRFYLAARVFYGFVWAMLTTVSLVYMVEHAHLDPLQMVLVGTALELSAFVFEIPTGVLADAVSRKLSVVIGHALMGLGWLLFALVPEFWPIVLSQVVWGVGWTFISGAYTAWLTDEIGIERANPALLKAAVWSRVAGFPGIAVCIALAHVWLPLPMVVGSVALIVLAIAMQLLMRETNFVPTATAERQSWRAMGGTFLEGVAEVRARPVLVTILVIAVVYGLFSEGFDRLFTPFLLDSFELPAIGALDSVTWWGIINAVALAVGFVVTLLVSRYVDVANHRALTNALALLTAGVAIALIGVTTVSSLVAVLACFWVVSGLRQAIDPLSTAWLNRLIPDRSRATLLSMQGQADAVGQAAAGPVVGAIGKYVSIAAALVVSAVVLLPAIWLYRLAGGQRTTREAA